MIFVVCSLWSKKRHEFNSIIYFPKKKRSILLWRSRENAYLFVTKQTNVREARTKKDKDKCIWETSPKICVTVVAEQFKSELVSIVSPKECRGEEFLWMCGNQHRETQMLDGLGNQDDAMQMKHIFTRGKYVYGHCQWWCFGILWRIL